MKLHIENTSTPKICMNFFFHVSRNDMVVARNVPNIKGVLIKTSYEIEFDGHSGMA